MGKNLVIKPTKPIAPKVVCYLVALGYITIAVLVILSIIGFSSGSAMKFLIIPSVVLIGFIIFCAKHFAWYKQGELEKIKGGFKFTETGCMDSMLGADKTVYTVHTPNEFKVKGDKVFITGVIEVKESMKKSHVIKNFVVKDSNKEVEDWLSEAFNDAKKD